MRIQARIFDWLALFFIVMTVFYGWWTWSNLGSMGEGDHKLEWVGTAGLLLTGLMVIMLGQYFRFVANRIDTPEDDPDGEIAHGEGELGFFSPFSFWPFWIAFSVLITGFGAAFWYYWLMLLGAAGLVVASCGLVFEYHLGRERH